MGTQKDLLVTVRRISPLIRPVCSGRPWTNHPQPAAPHPDTWATCSLLLALVDPLLPVTCRRPPAAAGL
mgnify:CR=1 FL=1